MCRTLNKMRMTESVWEQSHTPPQQRQRHWSNRVWGIRSKMNVLSLPHLTAVVITHWPFKHYQVHPIPPSIKSQSCVFPLLSIFLWILFLPLLAECNNLNIATLDLENESVFICCIWHYFELIKYWYCSLQKRQSWCIVVISTSNIFDYST